MMTMIILAFIAAFAAGFAILRVRTRPYELLKTEEKLYLGLFDTWREPRVPCSHSPD